MPEPLDFLGQVITEHCTIVYPVRQGSSMWLQKMKVSQVVRSGESYRLVVYDPTSSLMRGHSVKNLHTCVVVERSNDRLLDRIPPNVERP